MSKEKIPVTQAIRQLREHGVTFSEHLYKYEERGGTRVSARELGVDEHAVIKTLIMEDEQHHPLIVLMHGDREVGTGMLARQIGVKKVSPCEPKTADRHSGYQVGGTSPLAPAIRCRYTCRPPSRRCRASTSTVAGAAFWWAWTRPT